MNYYRLKNHTVEKASFILNREKEKNNNVEINIEGGILIPADYSDSKYLAFQLKFCFGSPEERIYLTLETLSTFEIETAGKDIEVKEEEVKEACLPIVLAELRKTVKKVTEAYGMTVVDLPPFEEENIAE